MGVDPVPSLTTSLSMSMGTVSLQWCHFESPEYFPLQTSFPSLVLLENAGRSTAAACSLGITTAKTTPRPTTMRCVRWVGTEGYTPLPTQTSRSWRISIRTRVLRTGAALPLHSITHLPPTLVREFCVSLRQCIVQMCRSLNALFALHSTVVNGSLALLPPPSTHFNGSNFNLSNNLLTMDPGWAVPDPRATLNFDLAPSSPAFAMGFQRIPSECFGPWRCGASEECPC